jgi:hypothetical protein
MNKMTLAGIMMAVTVLATGCKKDVDGDGKGPAQEAGAAIDNAGQTVATETKEATAEAAAATERAGERVEAATERAGERIEAAGAEVKQETRRHRACRRACGSRHRTRRRTHRSRRRRSEAGNQGSRRRSRRCCRPCPGRHRQSRGTCRREDARRQVIPSSATVNGGPSGPPFIVYAFFCLAIQPSTSSPSTSSGTEPAPSTRSWKAGSENLSPSSLRAFSRSSTMRSMPIM